MVAWRIWVGVLKSGSPIVKFKTSMPAACISLALADSARVAGGVMFKTRWDNFMIVPHFVVNLPNNGGRSYEYCTTFSDWLGLILAQCGREIS